MCMYAVHPKGYYMYSRLYRGVVNGQAAALPLAQIQLKRIEWRRELGEPLRSTHINTHTTAHVHRTKMFGWHLLVTGGTGDRTRNAKSLLVRTRGLGINSHTHTQTRTLIDHRVSISYIYEYNEFKWPSFCIALHFMPSLSLFRLLFLPRSVVSIAALTRTLEYPLHLLAFLYSWYGNWKWEKMVDEYTMSI